MALLWNLNKPSIFEVYFFSFTPLFCMWWALIIHMGDLLFLCIPTQNNRSFLGLFRLRLGDFWMYRKIIRIFPLIFWRFSLPPSDWLGGEKKTKKSQNHECHFHCVAKCIKGWWKICTLFLVYSQYLAKSSQWWSQPFFYIFQCLIATNNQLQNRTS